MIDELIDCIKTKDYKSLASLFENDRHVEYIDYCPSCVGYDNFYIYGNNAIEMFFRNKFYNNTFYIAEEQKIDNCSATFFGCYNDRFCYCRITIENYTQEGKIVKAVVRPE